jgi:hypothetical protein
VGRAKRTALPALFDGDHVTCPRCRARMHLLDVTVLPEMPLFEDQTVPVYKCACGWVFAPRQTPVTRRA